MDAELLELVSDDQDHDEYGALMYGRHSLYDYTRNGQMIDVKDLLLDLYEGRHSYEWLVGHRQLPVYVDEYQPDWVWE